MEKNAETSKDEQSVVKDSQQASETIADKQSTKAPVGKKFQPKAETPEPPPAIDPAFGQLAVEVTAAGNQSYNIELKDTGHLGLYLKRNKTVPVSTPVRLIPTAYFDGIRSTIRGALERLFKQRTEMSDFDFESRATEVATSLATGCVIITYMKLRSIAFTEHPELIKKLKKPRVSPDLPIPAPFAFAIQQLGIVHVADLQSDHVLFPVFPDDGHTYGLPDGISWNSNAYAQAMEYARKLGMQFNIVDLNLKKGSAWWLFRQVYEEDIFELECIIPEVNYTDAMAVTHSLFLKNTTGNPTNVFVELDAYTNIYGTMARNPHAGVNLSTFSAIEATATEVWSNV